MSPEITVDAVDIVERRTDDRGRISLGSDLGNATVQVAVIGIEDDGEQTDN